MQLFKDVQTNIRPMYVKKIEETLKKLEHETNFKDLVKIILFGSVARGDDLTSSDIDICLVTEDNINNHDRCTAKYVVLDDEEYPYVDCVTVRESTFNHNQEDWKLYKEIARDGVLLYENEKE